MIPLIGHFTAFTPDGEPCVAALILPNAVFILDEACRTEDGSIVFVGEHASVDRDGVREALKQYRALHEHLQDETRSCECAGTTSEWLEAPASRRQ